MKRLAKWLGGAFVALVLICVMPILVVETMCRGEALPQEPPRYITAETRPEARTYMVYPEWHIVYAYEGYAAALADGRPHNFPYLRSVTGFWSSLCGLTAKADELGEAGFNSKATIYTIGVSFTLEMFFKGAYEETLGRLFALFGPSPQDTIETEMAANYATFLQQTPWYKYDFPTWSKRLWEEPPSGLRGWERRIALSLEWGAKAQYAKLIAQAAAGLGADELTMRIAVRGFMPDLPEITVIAKEGDVTIAEVPRYRIFTTLAQQIAEAGGQFVEIAGNDDILVSLATTGEWHDGQGWKVVSALPRIGYDEDRVLLATKVGALHRLFGTLDPSVDELEHIYDY